MWPRYIIIGAKLKIKQIIAFIDFIVFIAFIAFIVFIAFILGTIGSIAGLISVLFMNKLKLWSTVYYTVYTGLDKMCPQLNLFKTFCEMTTTKCATKSV